MTNDRPAIDAVVFDLGGVLIDWNPRYLYRKLLPEDEVEAFLAEVGLADWNARQDAGRPWNLAVAELAAAHPERRALIEAFHDRWPETLGDEIAGTVDVLRELRDRGGARLLALSNWSAETFPVARERFDFLGWFEAVVISGEVGIAKPDPAIYEALVARHAVVPGEAVFIDDSVANVEMAARLGFRTLRFTGAAALRDDLATLGLLPAADPAARAHTVLEPSPAPERTTPA